MGDSLMDTDTSLLSRFASERDEEDFGHLVGRHAGWVRSQCLRILQDQALAEDATQAVFMILASKAPSIRTARALAA